MSRGRASSQATPASQPGFGLTVVACWQDCVQDGFYPFGAADQLQVALILCHAGRLSLPGGIDAALAAIRQAAAQVVGVRGYGLEPRSVADLIVLDA